MKTMLSVVAVLLSVSIVYSDDAIFARIEAAQKIDVPMPESTPYDSDPKARAVYLEEYIKAYRLILAAVAVDCHMSVKGYYEDAFRDGWTAGKKDALQKYPEKAAQMYGFSQEDYRRYIEGKDVDDKK